MTPILDIVSERKDAMCEDKIRIMITMIKDNKSRCKTKITNTLP